MRALSLSLALPWLLKSVCGCEELEGLGEVLEMAHEAPFVLGKGLSGRARQVKSYASAVSSQPPVYNRTSLLDMQVAWLHKLVNESQLLADLSFADIIIWAPTNAGSFVAMSHLRPSSAATLFYHDIVETDIRPEWLGLVTEVYSSGIILDSASPSMAAEVRSRVRAVPVSAPGAGRYSSPDRRVIAVLTRHSNISESRIPSRQELTFDECANYLFGMIAEGSFPHADVTGTSTQGIPRASDGLIVVDSSATVTFASPNARSAFLRMGFQKKLEGAKLPEVTRTHTPTLVTGDETLLSVLNGRAPLQSDITRQGVTITLRAIPLSRNLERSGAIILTRDVTQVRLREKEMVTKDATIREIHHRVKNNLQTVASLLRIQMRRTNSEVAKEALGQAMRRVGAIAVVHDTLSEGLSQTVDFDVVLQRVLILVAEVASADQITVKPLATGQAGLLPSEYATPLAVVLAELVTNAVVHGIKLKRDGEVAIESTRLDGSLIVLVVDNGGGLTGGKVGDGLGTQIVRTLVNGELGGSIVWNPRNGGGTEVRIEVPLRNFGLSGPKVKPPKPL